ncbi:MAG: DUF2141 domain-containing protein [Parvularculaceae bacterium]
MASAVLRNFLGVLAMAGGCGASTADAAFEHVSCTGAPNEVRVTVSNVKQSAGLMTAELFRNEPENFLKKAGREFRVRYAALAPVTQFCVHAPAAGEFAIVVYHDENANRKFDKNGLGIPKEPFGISNDPAIKFGPPPIDKALFEVASTGASVEIRLRN